MSILTPPKLPCIAVKQADEDDENEEEKAELELTQPILVDWASTPLGSAEKNDRNNFEEQ